MAYQNVTSENLDKLLTSTDNPVLLDFWAPWCGPCMQLGPVLEAIGDERDDIIIGKVNIDEEMALARQFRIMSIPTLVVLKDGNVSARAVGFRTKDEILKLLEK